MIRRRRKQKTAGQLQDLTLTPLIDTALTLLVIFMITTPMIQNAIRVTLPKGQAKEDGGAQQELVVFIDKEKKIFFQGAEQKPESLVSVLKEKIAGQENKMVFVKADQAVSYGSVLELVDHIKVVGGISHVVLATQKA